MEQAGFLVTDVEILPLHYADTLREWRRRFLSRRDEVLALYDERFLRMWEFYLAVSEAAFRMDRMFVVRTGRMSMVIRTYPSAMNSRARKILWVDCGAGGVVGALMLVLRDPLVDLYDFPLALVTFIAAANLTYASYSLTLALRALANKTPSRRAIDVLVIANLLWAVACAVMLSVTFRQASLFGLAHIALEGLFVAALAVTEHRQVRPYARRRSLA